MIVCPDVLANFLDSFSCKHLAHLVDYHVLLVEVYSSHSFASSMIPFALICSYEHILAIQVFLSIILNLGIDLTLLPQVVVLHIMYYRCIVLKAFEKLRGLSAYYRWW